MYVPDHFKEEDQEKLKQHIRDYSFGLFVIADDEGVEANHVPFYLSSGSDNSLGYLQCHLARNNPVWQRIQSGVRVVPKQG
jgi:transcriptional regulator